MNKIFKTLLIALAGIIFFGVNVITAPTAHAATTIQFFNVAPKTVTSGSTVLLSWQSDGDACVITGGPFGITGASQPVTGTVSPKVTTTQTTPETISFTLRCWSTIGGATTSFTSKDASVVVNPAGTQPAITISASPNPVPNGTNTVTMNWTATNTNVDGCVASGSWSGTKSYGGSETVPAVDGRYILTCTGPGGTASNEVRVSLDSSKVSGGDQTDADTFLKNLTCSFSLTNFRIDGCFGTLLYYALYQPVGMVFTLSALFFDMVMSMSIDQLFVNQQFVVDVWTIVRNFSNMIFIFILLYTGISTMLGYGDWKKTVIRVVIIALLINFSLFFTKVVIDAGNILAVGVYSSIGKEKPPAQNHIKDPKAIKERDISLAIVTRFKPQAFVGQNVPKDGLDAIIIILIASVVSGFAAFIFFKVAFVFMGRLIAFWFLMMISPFALISSTIPGKANIFDWWLDELISQSFVAPVFLFLLYIIMQVITAGGGILGNLVTSATTADTAGFIFDKLIVPAVIAALILLALNKAMKVAEKMGGEFGAAASKFVGGAIGTVAQVGLTAASGGAALAAGKLGAAAIASGKLQEAAQSSSVFKRTYGKLGLLAADKAQTATFDPRNIGGGIGKQIGKGLGAFGVKPEGGKFNYAGQTKNWKEQDWAGDNKLEEQKRLGRLMEIPQAEMEAAKNQVADLDRLVTLAEEAAKEKAKQAGGPVEKEAAEQKAKEKLKEAVTAEDEILAEIKKAEKAGDDARADAARNSLAAASAQVVAARTIHKQTQAENEAAKAAFENSNEVKEVNARKKAKEDAQKVLRKLEEENQERYEILAKQKETPIFVRAPGGQPTILVKGNRALAQGIRDHSKSIKTPKSEAEQEEDKSAAKVLQSAAKSAAKKAASSPTP